MFTLPESWVWDFWLADDGDQYHLFFLYASRALHEPDRRHYRASIGHAVSSDLQDWTRVTDALVRSDAPAFDDLATWTGSVVRHPDGTWFLFYTGSTLTPAGNRQTIGYATSDDLMTWTKSADQPGAARRRRLVRGAGRRPVARRGVPRPVGVPRPGRRRLAHARSPPGRARVPPTTAASSATPGPRTCAPGSSGRR